MELINILLNFSFSCFFSKFISETAFLYFKISLTFQKIHQSQQELSLGEILKKIQINLEQKLSSH